MSPSLFSVSEALERLLSGLNPLPAEGIALEDGMGRVLAEDVVAGSNLPPFSNSAMDGFAVRAQDTQPASAEAPVILRVIGDISAGIAPPMALAPGTAMRIMTGAPLPESADAVVPVEETAEPEPMAGRELPRQIEVLVTATPGRFVRRAGLDVRAGQTVLRAGQRLRPQDVAMLAALGVARPNVHRQARVAILSTGDELLEPDQPLTPGRIHDANGYSLAASVRSAGAIPLRRGIVGDSQTEVARALDWAVETGADLILSSAGVSMGAFDYVRPVIEERGRLEFWKVNIRPGKPLAVGSYRDVPFMGLPGNPVAVLVVFEVFVRRALERLHGQTEPGRLKLVARLDRAVESDGRESYLRAEIDWQQGEYHARLTGSQDSSVLSTLVAANALIVVPAGVYSLPAGELIEAWFL
ncbi:MAG: molybdopterin molybdotransferase MoeA [Anaerolineales bacterium]|nr:molybdopterin molybdotransferase MoeA [Anaerolineales bacterium]